MKSYTVIEIKSIAFDKDTDLSDPTKLSADLQMLIADISTAQCSAAALTVGLTSYLVAVPTEELPIFVERMRYWIDREAGKRQARPAGEKRKTADGDTCAAEEVTRLTIMLDKSTRQMQLAQMTIEAATAVVKDLLETNSALAKKLAEAEKSS